MATYVSVVVGLFVPEGCSPLAMGADVEAELAHVASRVDVAMVGPTALLTVANSVNIWLPTRVLSIAPWNQFWLHMGGLIDELGFEGAERAMLARIMLVDDDDSCVPAKVAAKPFDGP